MKDYNSIPFKNKSIDRLTRNTTIIPDTQIKEVTITPSPKQVSNYVNNADKKFDENMDKWEGLYAANYEIGSRFSKERLNEYRDSNTEYAKNRRSTEPKYINPSPSIFNSRENLKKSEVVLNDAQKIFDNNYNKSNFTKMDTNSLEGMKVDHKNKFNSNLMGVKPGKKPNKRNGQ